MCHFIINFCCGCCPVYIPFTWLVLIYSNCYKHCVLTAQRCPFRELPWMEWKIPQPCYGLNLTLPHGIHMLKSQCHVIVLGSGALDDAYVLNAKPLGVQLVLAEKTSKSPVTPSTLWGCNLEVCDPERVFTQPSWHTDLASHL